MGSSATATPVPTDNPVQEGNQQSGGNQSTSTQGELIGLSFAL